MPDEATALTDPDLPALYRSYLDGLNRRELAGLGEFVDDDVRHNDWPLGLAGYRDMLERDFREIQDLRFDSRQEPTHRGAT